MRIYSSDNLQNRVFSTGSSGLLLTLYVFIIPGKLFSGYSSSQILSCHYNGKGDRTKRFCPEGEFIGMARVLLAAMRLVNL